MTLELRIQKEIKLLRDEIEAAQPEIEEISSGKSIGEHSRINTIELYALVIETQRRRKSRLTFLEAICNRMDDIENGECEICHQDISGAKLDAQPEARRCYCYS